MRFATPALINLLRGKTRIPFAECFTLVTQYGADIGTLTAQALGNPVGRTYFYTSSDADVQIGNFLYMSRGLLIKGIKYKLKTGLEVDEQTVTVHADDTVTVDGVPFLQAVARGLLDGARFKQERAFFDPDTWPARPGLPNKVVGSVVQFSGAINNIEGIGRTSATMKVRSDLSLLDVEMPRNLYQASCLHTLFDAGCGLNRKLFTVGGVVGAGTTTTKSIDWSNPNAAGYFAQGVVRFTSGANIGLSRPVLSSGTGGFAVIFPFPVAPQAGDTFQITPGCDHTLDTCKAKFMNDRNFRGFPYVPPPETAV